MTHPKISVGIVDDHTLVVKSLGMMISNFESFEVMLEAFGGADLQDKVAKANTLPQIILIDVNMPVMDGVEVASWLSEFYPDIKLIALSMNNDDVSVAKMMKAGCCAYLSKNVSHIELEKALTTVQLYGYYNGDLNINRIIKKNEDAERHRLTEREIEFILLCCSDQTYHDIARTLNLSDSRVDDIRKTIFTKLNIKSRVGLVLEAIRHNIIDIEKIPAAKRKM